MTLAHSSETLAPDSRVSRGESGTRRKPRRLRALASAAIHALPDEYTGLRDTFRQTRTDMTEVHRIVAEDQGTELETRVTRRDVIKYMSWRMGVTGGYQVTDDFYSLPAFMALKDAFNTPVAYAAVNLASTGLAFGLGMAERRAQKWKAEAQGVDTRDFEGPMIDHLLDASVNSAPYNVLIEASKPREEGAPVELMTPAQIAAMSEAYGGLNTLFYAGSTKIPGLESYQAFGVSLLAMFQLKGTIRGYRERMSDQAEASVTAPEEVH